MNSETLPDVHEVGICLFKESLRLGPFVVYRATKDKFPHWFQHRGPLWWRCSYMSIHIYIIYSIHFTHELACFFLEITKFISSFCGSWFPSLWLSCDLDICPVKHFAQKNTCEHSLLVMLGVMQWWRVSSGADMRVNQTRQHRGLMLHLITLPLPYVTPQAIDLQMESQE